MFYINNPGETLGNIVYDHYGHLGGNYLQRAIEINGASMSMGGMILGQDMLLAPYQIIYLPEAFMPRFDPLFALSMLNNLPWAIRYKLKCLYENNIDPRLLVSSAVSATIYHNNVRSQVVLDGVLSGTSFTHGGAKMAEEKAKKFKEAKEDMDKALLKYREQFHDDGMTQTIRDAYAKEHLRLPYDNMIKAYDARIRLHAGGHFPVGLANMRRSILNRGGALARKGFLIDNNEQIVRLVHLSKRLQFLGRSIVCLDIGLGAIKVYEDYKSGDKEWSKEAAKTIGGIAGADVAASIAATALALTPIGWVALLVGGLVAIGGEILGEKIGEEAWRHFSDIESAFSKSGQEYNNGNILYGNF